MSSPTRQDRVVATYQQLLANSQHNVILAEVEIAALRDELYQANCKLERYQETDTTDDEAPKDPDTVD